MAQLSQCLFVENKYHLQDHKTSIIQTNTINSKAQKVRP